MFNSEKTIINALTSVIEQDLKVYEVIVVNDGSIDGSQNLVENFVSEHPNVRINLVNKENGGVSSARNTGIKMSNGDWIAFLDSDDVWFGNKLSSQKEAIDQGVDAIDFLAAGYQGLYFNGRKNCEVIKICVKDLIYKNYFQPSTVIMKRKIVDKIGYFDENQKYAEEGNYFIRIANQYNCFFLNTKLINYGDGKSGFGVSGLSSNVYEMQKGFEKNLKFANENKFINYPTYLAALIYSKLKYIRRLIIIKLR